MSDTVLDKLAGINPLLSNMIVGVGGDQNFIADQVLPVVPVRAETVTYRKGANEAKVVAGATNTLRPVGALPRTLDLSFDTATATLLEYAHGYSVDYREVDAAQANPDAILDIKMAKAAAAKSKVLIDKEQAVADVVFAAGNYTSRTSSSVDFATTGIRKTVLEAKDTVRLLCGYAPNTLVLGPQAEMELMTNADLQTILNYAGNVGVPGLQAIAQFLGVERIVVGSATSQTAASAGDAGTGSYIWTSDSAALIYVNRNAPSLYNPSFGYLFQMTYSQTGSAELVVEWQNNPFISEGAYAQRFVPVATFVKAGYLWTNVDQA